ncbi:hypothetical protein [Paragemmobacter ruber]|uniref:Uncharacterized protein n=1 Tax=Paragemmobacter ruber TaxID=1985673 RepID=A0ABW9YA06_9RHOB|nr:hypothetical protein [Rhodobacter ruber]NBE08984.1 hypothetical protein [Rhodobacter ruber]
MCYGNLDPKLAMRDIEARVKHLSSEQDRTKQAAPGARQTGLLARLRDAAFGLLRKDRVHV